MYVQVRTPGLMLGHCRCSPHLVYRALGGGVLRVLRVRVRGMGDDVLLCVCLAMRDKMLLRVENLQLLVRASMCLAVLGLRLRGVGDDVLLQMSLAMRNEVLLCVQDLLLLPWRCQPSLSMWLRLAMLDKVLLGMYNLLLQRSHLCNLRPGCRHNVLVRYLMLAHPCGGRRRHLLNDYAHPFWLCRNVLHAGVNSVRVAFRLGGAVWVYLLL